MKDHAKRGSLLLLAASVIWGSTLWPRLAASISGLTFNASAPFCGFGPAARFCWLRVNKETPNMRRQQASAASGRRRGVVLFQATVAAVWPGGQAQGQPGSSPRLHPVRPHPPFRGHRVPSVLGVHRHCRVPVSAERQGRLPHRHGDLLLLMRHRFAVQICWWISWPKVSGIAVQPSVFASGLLSGAMVTLESLTRPMAAQPGFCAGVLSSGVAYTLQIFGQRTTPPAIASLPMSLNPSSPCSPPSRCSAHRPGMGRLRPDVWRHPPAQRGQFQNSVM